MRERLGNLQSITNEMFAFHNLFYTFSGLISYSFSATINTALPAIFSAAVNKLQNQGFGSEADDQPIVLWGGAFDRLFDNISVQAALVCFGLAWTLSNLAKVISPYLMSGATKKVKYTLFQKAFSQLYQLPTQFVENKEVEELAFSSLSPYHIVDPIVNEGLNILVTSIELFVIGCVFSEAYGWPIPIGAVTLLGLHASILSCTSHYFSGEFETLERLEKQTEARIYEMVRYFKTIKSFNASDHEFEKLNRRIEPYNQKLSIKAKSKCVRQSTQYMTSGIGLIIALLTLGSSVDSPQNSLTTKDFIFMITYTLQFLMPLVSLNESLASFNNSLFYLSYYNSLVHRVDRIIVEEKANASLSSTQALSIEFKSVNFSYQEKMNKEINTDDLLFCDEQQDMPETETFSQIPQPLRSTQYEIIDQKDMKEQLIQSQSSEEDLVENIVLRNVSFKIEAGQSAILIGQSGSGKSTIIKLILGLYKPISGEILINGKNIELYDKKDLYKAIGINPQEVDIFKGSLKYNMTYGFNHTIDCADDVIRYRSSISSEEFKKVVSKVELEHLVDSKSDCQINKDKLSGGEKQRIGMSRVLLKKPGLFIFDEATSALDMITEDKILEKVCRIHKETGATLLIVAHRLSSVYQVDKILILKDGYIKEETDIQGYTQGHERRPSGYGKLWGDRKTFVVDTQQENLNTGILEL